MELRPTGIPGLDELLGGGIPTSALTLLLGPAGGGKSLLARQFLWEGIKRKEPCVCILTETHRQALRHAMKSFGWDISPYENRNLIVVDSFTWSSSEFIEHMADREFVLEALDLDKLVHLISLARQRVGPGGRGALDSLSDLFILHGDERKVLRFLSRIKVRTAHLNLSVIITLDPHTQLYRFTRAAMHIADGIIEIRLRETQRGLQRELRIRAMPQGHDTTWHPLKITPKGIQIQ